MRTDPCARMRRGEVRKGGEENRAESDSACVGQRRGYATLSCWPCGHGWRGCLRLVQSPRVWKGSGGCMNGEGVLRGPSKPLLSSLPGPSRTLLRPSSTISNSPGPSQKPPSTRDLFDVRFDFWINKISLVILLILTGWLVGRTVCVDCNDASALARHAEVLSNPIPKSSEEK